MHVFLKLLFLVVSAVTVMLFACPEAGCNLSFSSTRGLNQHRQQCIYAQDESLPLSGTDALAILNERRAKKRRRINPPELPEDSQMSVAAGSSNIGHEVRSIFYVFVHQNPMFYKFRNHPPA
jgi:hypothetical protein